MASPDGTHLLNNVDHERSSRKSPTRLVIAPHCDDEVLGCGGLLAKYPEDCAVVVLAQPDGVRRKEFEAARAVLGYETVRFLDIADGYVGADMTRLVAALDELVDELRPDELYLPSPSMHRTTSQATRRGCESVDSR